MNQRLYIHPRDAQGRRLRAIRSNGLVNRRRLESVPFQPQRTRRKKHCLLLFMVVSATAFADQTPADEISARSGLPASDVAALLNNCDSSQTSMNFCA